MARSSCRDPCALDKHALFLIPQQDPEEIQMALAELSEKHEPGLIADINSVLPPDWGKDFTPHLYPIRDHIADIMQDPDFVPSTELLRDLERDGVTHVALLESKLKPDGSTPFYFGRGTKIAHISIVLYWCGTQFRSLHCANCCYGLAGWVSNMQEQWDESFRFPKGSRTLN